MPIGLYIHTEAITIYVQVKAFFRRCAVGYEARGKARRKQRRGHYHLPYLTSLGNWVSVWGILPEDSQSKVSGSRGSGQGSWRKARIVPSCNHPDGRVFNPVEEAIGRDEDFSEWEFRKLGNTPSRFWELDESPKCLFGFATKSAGSQRTINKDEFDRRKKLRASSGRE